MAGQSVNDGERLIQQMAVEASSTDPALRECVDFYHREMEKVLPEMNDEALFHFHLENKRKAMENFLSRTARLATQDYSLALINEAVERAFLEVVNTNWLRCESYCQEVLTNFKFSVITSLPSLKSRNTECQSQWWSRIKSVRKKYIDSIGDSMNNLMPHVWLRYLNERQEQDYEVIMGDIDLEREKVDELNDVDTSSPSQESFDGDVAYEPLPMEADSKAECNVYTDFSSETVEKQLRLQMTWGRIFVFWKYWIDCRKDSTELLEKFLGVVAGCEESSGGTEATATSHTHTSDVHEAIRKVFRRIQQDVSCRSIPLDFARVIRKDFLSYNCLVQKLQDFLDTVLSPDCVCAFDMNPTGIFQSISTFQSDMIFKPCGECQCFRACAKFLEREQDESNSMTRMIGRDSKQLFHLRTFIGKMITSRPEVRLSVAVREFVSELVEEKRDWSLMLSESIDALLTVASNVTEAIPQLRRDILEWSPKRDETIAQLRPIIDKLHETTKNVAITQTISSSVGIVGGAIAIGGLILAPFTLGASLIPTAIAGGVVSGLGAATAIGAAVTEIVIDKGEMEKALTCLQQDKVLFEGVANQVKYMNLNSTLLLRYIPQDELESFISVITDPKSTAMLSVSSSTPQIKQQIAVHIARLVSVGGKAVMMPVSRLVIAGTIAASRIAILALAHGIAAVGMALDIANLVVAGIKLGKGARSQSAEKLEEVIVRLEEEKRIVDNCLSDIDLDF